MKKTSKKIFSILISCILVTGTLSSACLPARAEEETAAEKPAVIVQEEDLTGTAVEETTAEAEEQPQETKYDAASYETVREDDPVEGVVEETAVEAEEQPQGLLSEPVWEDNPAEGIVEEAAVEAEEQPQKIISESSWEDNPAADVVEETIAEAEEQNQEMPAGETDALNILYPAFSDEKTVDGITVCVSAGEGIFPEGAALSVEHISDGEQQAVGSAVENSRAADVTVAASYTFDIKVLDQEGNEIQPADGRSVTVSFAAAEAADRNLEASVYHVADGEAEALDTVCEGNTVKAETDGFSYYTVEFTYGTLKYSLPGNGTVALKTVLDILGLTGEVTNAESSAPELFSVDNTDGTWRIISHKSFTSKETLTVTINGIVYVIEVTDPAETYPVWFNGEQITSETCDDVLHDGGSVKYDPVTKTMTFDNPVLKGDLPFEAKALIVIDGITLTITGKAEFKGNFFGTADGINLMNGAELIFDNAYYVFDDPVRPIVSDDISTVTVQNSHVEALGMNWCGIAAGYIVIKSGYVKATGGNYGLWAHNDVVIDDGYVDTTGIHSYSSDVIINGGTVLGPIDAEGDININGGTVWADASKAWWIYGYDYGLAAEGTIRIGGGISSVIAEAENALLARNGIEIAPTNVVDYPFTGTFVQGPPPWYTEYVTLSSGAGTQPAKYVRILPYGSHKIEYDANGHGEDPVTRYVKDGETAPVPIEPKEKGCMFGGWYTEAGCFNEYDFTQPVYADLILYAKWYPDVNVTFNVQGHGYAPAKQTMPYGGTAAQPKDPYAEGYSFSGWYTDPECTIEYDFSIPVTADITLYALWLADPIVTFDVQGHGTAPEAQQIKYGDTATEPAEPSAEGYSFAGWYTDPECTNEYDFSIPLTEDITLYALWLADAVITFDVQGHGTAPETQKIKNGDTATEPAEPSAEGYTFRGWYTDAACTAEYDFSDPVTADITLYARWLVNVNGLKLHADGTKKDGTYYILDTDVLEPVFEKDTEEAAIELGYLCTDSSCSNMITELPEKGTTYFFTVYMKDASSYEKGIQRIMFLPEIANNINASAEDAVIEFDGLVSSESGDAVTLLFKYTENEIIYIISKGADASWTKGTSTGVDYTVNRNINDSKTYGLFESIEVDGKTVDASQYNAASGSLNASFKAAYLETLSKGVHTVTFRFKDGSAATKITIKKKTSVKTNSTEKTKSSGRKTPNTGDSNHTELWIGLLFLSLIILIRMTTCRKRDLNT